MKKFTTIALAFVLALGMTVTAFAAGSPVTSVNAGNTVTIGGEEVAAEIKVTTVENTVSEEAAGIADVLSNETAEATIISDVVDVTLPDNIVPTADKPVTITFQVTGVSSDDTILVAHKKADGEWEYITPSAIANGSVTVPFTSLSPVAFIKVTENVKADVADDEDTEEEEASASDSDKSPKTGETNALYVEFLAAASLCGAAVCFKRSTRNNI